MLAQRPPKITICPPGKAAGSESRETAYRERMPVSGHFEAGGEASSTGISFDDYARMRTFKITRGSSRRYETPSWVLNPKRREEVFMKYCDLRVHRDTSQLK